MRMLPVVNRVAEHAPAATACCNACRTCAANNVFALLLGDAEARDDAAEALAQEFAPCRQETEPRDEPQRGEAARPAPLEARAAPSGDDEAGERDREPDEQ